MCRIYEIFPEKRTCSIKTYGSDPLTSSQDYTDVQWLSPYSSPEGDEVSYVPQLNSQALCVFLMGVPWIIGFFNPITADDDTEIIDQEDEGNEPSGASAAQNKEKVNAGDFIFRTAGKCRFVLRRGGEIEIESTKLCRTTYFPAQNRINELCQNYEFRTDGGTIDWVHIDPQSDKTVCNTEWRDDVNRSNTIIDQKGSIEAGSTLIHRFAIGPGVVPTVDGVETEFKPVFIRETHNDGKTEFKINEIAFTELINPDGETTRGIGGYRYYENIKPTGEITLNINNNFQSVILPTGELTIDIGIEKEKAENQPPEGGEGKFKLNVKPTGDTTLTINGKLELKMGASGLTTLNIGGGKSTVTITPDGAVSIKSATEVVAETPLANIKASKIKLGSGVSDVVPLGRLLLKLINKFIQTYNSHNHSALGAAPPGQRMQSIGEDVLSKTVEVQG
jgi:hypothetical protein